jgi:hypothetical protein
LNNFCAIVDNSYLFAFVNNLCANYSNHMIKSKDNNGNKLALLLLFVSSLVLNIMTSTNALSCSRVFLDVDNEFVVVL